MARSRFRWVGFRVTCHRGERTIAMGDRLGGRLRFVLAVGLAGLKMEKGTVLLPIPGYCMVAESAIGVHQRGAADGDEGQGGFGGKCAGGAGGQSEEAKNGGAAPD